MVLEIWRKCMSANRRGEAEYEMDRENDEVQHTLMTILYNIIQMNHKKPQKPHSYSNCALDEYLEASDAISTSYKANRAA